MSEFPRIQLTPGPRDRLTFEVDGRERLTYYYGADLPRPFLYPLVGPAGRSLTRLGHPRDPHGHRHHRGIWTGHHQVNAGDWWTENGNRIRCERLLEIVDGPFARLAARHQWVDSGGQAVLREQWSVTYHELPDAEALIEIHLRYECPAAPVTFGKTPFGFLGLRVAKTMSVEFGDGRILNSEGAVNEKELLWKPARWVDYSGPVLQGRTNGITVMDATDNPRHPTCWHVRDDGWIGASFCYDAPYPLEREKPLELRYGLYVHDGPANPAKIAEHYGWWTGR